MITALFSLLLLVDATETSASEPAPVSSAPAAKTAPAEERKICKREASTESRLGNKRICLTKEEWELRERVDD